MPAAAPKATRPRLPPLPMSRRAGWFLLLAAGTLIGMSLGSYLYHRRQLDAIAARHLRLVVAGPAELHAGAPSEYNLLATRLSGEPWPAPVEWSLWSADGKRLLDRKETTDEQGRLLLLVPADMDLGERAGTAAELRVAAGAGANAAAATFSLPIRAPQYLTRLESDRRSYRPGDTVYYRSLTVSRYGLSAERVLPLEFELLDPKSQPLADSRRVGLADHGVGSGSMQLPQSLAAGTYTLIARGADADVAEAHLNVEVAAAATKQIAADANRPLPARPAAARIDFFPEGGSLTAGIANRVYFSARDSDNRPVEVRGDVIDGRGNRVAPLEAAADGCGQFDFTPAVDEAYRARIERPSESAAPLPRATADGKLAIEVEHAVVAAGEPLRLLVHAKGRLPLLAAVSARGLPAGQQLFVAAGAPGRETAVTIPLDEHAAGLIRLTVYDCTKTPPCAVAERLIFRQPRRLTVKAEAVQPGGPVQLLVKDEKGLGAAAALGVTVVAETKAAAEQQKRPADAEAPARRPREGLLSALLFADGDTTEADLADLAFAPLDTNAAKQAAEFALACRLASPRGERPSAEAPPLISDNLAEIRGEYEGALGDYRAQRTRAINALIMLSFFGGLGLALLVTMLALFRIVSGSQLWIPTIAAMFCCAVVTAVSNDPSRMQPVEVAAVEFAPYAPPESADRASAGSRVSKPVNDPLRRLAERLAHSEGDAEKLKADRFPAAEYTSPPHGDAASDAPEPCGWYPLLIAGADGHVTVPGISASVKNLRLWVEAQDSGRMESCELRP